MGSSPLANPIKKRQPLSSRQRLTGEPGTLREAAQIALDTHWSSKRYHDAVKYTVMVAVDFMENRGASNIDDITSEDLDALVKQQRDKGNSSSTINKYLGALSVVNQLALKRIPPLATVKLPIEKVAKQHIEKWWLRPEDHIKVTTALRDPLDGTLITDPLLADLIDVIAYSGLRIEEALRLEERMVSDLNGKDPWMQPPGTKTASSQNSIPIFPKAIEPLRSAIERARENRWSLLFPIRPRQVSDRWNVVRQFLGVEDIQHTPYSSVTTCYLR